MKTLKHNVHPIVSLKQNPTDRPSDTFWKVGGGGGEREENNATQ